MIITKNCSLQAKCEIKNQDLAILACPLLPGVVELAVGVVGVVAGMAGGVVGNRWGKLALIGEVPTRMGHMLLRWITYS